MHVDIRRGLAFFDQSDRVLGRPSLTRFDARTGLLQPVEGARDDDVVCDVSRDGKHLLLRSAERLVVRGRDRSRITILTKGAPACTTERINSHWSVLAPMGRFALVGTLNANGRSIVMETATCEPVALARVGIDARFGEVDPLDGRLWAPHTHLKGTVLSVDCATGDTGKTRFATGSVIVRVRFAPDGASLLAVGEKGTLSRHGRDESLIWSIDISGIGPVGAGDLFLNQAGSHVLFSLMESRNSEWGEDLIVSMARGTIEETILRRRGPPSRLMADWFGDHALTYAGEIIDFFTGRVVGKLPVRGRQTALNTALSTGEAPSLAPDRVRSAVDQE